MVIVDMDFETSWTIECTTINGKLQYPAWHDQTSKQVQDAKATSPSLMDDQ